MYRTVRFQVIAIVVAVVASILGASQWINMRLTEEALEQDLRERALTVLQAASRHWGETDREELQKELRTLVEARPQMLAIDIFEFRQLAPHIAVTTRTGGERSGLGFVSDEATRLLDGETLTSSRMGADGIPSWRVAVPLNSGDAITGAIQVEVRPVELLRLQRTLRIIDLVFLAASLLLIVVLLAFFFEWRVARPVSLLVERMKRAEAGDLATRTAPVGGGEFDFLARSLDSMLDQIQQLTTGLEERVQAATQHLAHKNRELIAVNEQLWRAQRELGQSERWATLGQMAATIAHEMGTPLNSILGYTQLLRREKLPPEYDGKLAIVESQVQRMIETIRSILDRTHGHPSALRPVPLGPLVSDTLALLSVRLAETGVTVHNEVPLDLPPVTGNHVELRQMLVNVLNNSIDASRADGTITLSAKILHNNGRRPAQIELCIADNGHGMSAQEVQHLFEPFYTTKAPGHGTGLGLTIVDHIVRAHRGQVFVDSDLGVGTTVRVRLPLES